jgi:hypothetical protein
MVFSRETTTSQPRPVTLWDMENLRAGCGPDGKCDPYAAFWLGFLTGAPKQAGVRFTKYRFNRKPGAPDPDACNIILAGNHIPATLQRALQWSVARHGLTERMLQ